MRKLNFLLVDDEVLVREGVRALLSGEDFVKQIVEAGNKNEFELVIATHPIDIVLLDFRLLDTNGFELLKILKKQKVEPKVIMLTGFEGPELIINLLKVGVDSIVFKLDGYREIFKAINGVMEARNYLPEKILTMIRERAHLLDDTPPVQLTFHERELLKAIARGLTTKEIATVLKLPETTAETYRIRLIKKMRVPNTAALLAYAFRNGML
jgi:DNA-binding NarL/FixJ family response regulator